MLEGKRIEIFQKMTSGVPSKVRAGGQSSQRFHRITEGLTKEFYKRIADEMKKIFFEMPKLKGILIGGPIPTKDEFVSGEYLPTRLQEKVIGVRDIGGSDESGLKELVEKSRDLLENQEIVREKKLLEKFFENLGSPTGLVEYKEDAVRKALQFGAVNLLLISRDFDKAVAREFKKLAEQMGTNVEMVSTETEEGQQFFSMSGVGALLRFKV
jgi:peptide chain release factor subunit 1